MPCRNDYEDNKPVKKSGIDFEAVLCGAIRAFGIDDIVNSIEWDEVGETSQAIRAWWKEHKKKDDARIKKEEARKKEVAKMLLASLSDEELQVIKEGWIS